MKKEQSAVRGRRGLREKASEAKNAICQDAGVAVLYVELSREVLKIGGNIREAVSGGVKGEEKEGYLRKSIVVSKNNERMRYRRKTEDIMTYP